MKNCQNPNKSKSFVPNLLKKAFVCLFGFAVLFCLAACNTTQPQTPDPSPNPTPDPDVVEKTSVNEIYDQNFADTSFDQDIQTAQIAICNRAFENLDPQITQIEYDDAAKQLTFTVSYTENNTSKTGSMTFAAPEVFQTLRTKSAKAVVLEVAGLSADSQIEKTKTNEIKGELSTAIDSLKSQISSGFANIQDITVKKQQDPIETVTVGEIFDQNFANLNFDAEIEEAFQAIYQKGYRNAVVNTLFYSVDAEKKEISVYADKLESNRNSLIELKFASPDSILKLFKNSVKEIVCEELGIELEINKNNQAETIAAIENAVDAVKNDISTIRDIEIRDITSKSSGRNTNDISNYEDFGKKLLTDLNVPEENLIAAYVGAMSIQTIDNTLFNTGYSTSFDMAVVYRDGVDIKIYASVIFVPWYTNSTNQSLYNSFLNGQEDITYKLRNQSTTVVSSPVMAQTQPAQTSNLIFLFRQMQLKASSNLLKH